MKPGMLHWTDLTAALILGGGPYRECQRGGHFWGRCLMCRHGSRVDDFRMNIAMADAKQPSLLSKTSAPAAEGRWEQ